MKRTNTIAIALAAAMLLPSSAFAASPADFSDFPSDWSAPALTQAVENGLLNGANGKIDPYGQLTRAEMAAIVNRAFGAVQTASLAGYTDARTDAWYYTDLAKAVQMGTFTGAGDRLQPDDPITREQAFTVLARAFALEAENADALNRFADGGDTAAWAANSVAALVQAGYVNGANGKLNAKASITRAEFAQVISGMAAAYVGAEGLTGQTVDGTVIVRAGGAQLQDVTIHGDLILADGVDAGEVVLKNVTVDGRILLRGGAAGVDLQSVTVAGEVIVDSPNGGITLTAQDSSLDTIELHSDAVVDADAAHLTVAETAKLTVQGGRIDKVTVEADAAGSSVTVNKGAAVDQVQADASGVRVSGAGTVSNVYANADDVTVTTGKTKVEAAQDVSHVTAGGASVAAGSSATTNASGSGVTGGASSGGGGSSGGSGSSGGGGSSKPQESTADFVSLQDTKIIDVGYAQYAVITFKSGSVDDYELALNGKPIEPTRVDTAGTIVKYELEALDGQVLTVTRDGKTQTITLKGAEG